MTSHPLTHFAALRRHRWLLLLLALYLLLGAATSVVVPLGEAPDELDHFLYVHHLVRQRTFPLMEPDFAANETLEANQPPLYYLLGALLTGWLPQDEAATLPRNACFSADPADPGRQTFYRHGPAEQFPWSGTTLAFHLVRLLSLLCGAGAVLLAYALARDVCTGDERTALVAASLLAFNPQFLFITASANNDSLTALLGATILFAAVRVARRPAPPPARALLPLALFVGLGALTKFSLLGLWPLAFLALLLPAWRARRVPWSGLLTLTLIPLLVAGWWYARATLLYGDPLAWQVHLAAKGPYVLRTTPLRPADLLDFVVTHFQSYWGWFGWLNIKLPAPVYLLLAALVLAALTGLFRAAARRPLRRLPIAALFATLAVLLVYASLFRYIQTINWSGYQGRLAFTAAAPIAVLLAAGLRALSPRLAVAGGAALFALACAALVAVFAPAYPRPLIYQPDPATVTFATTCARFPAGLELEAYTLDGPVTPGASLPVRLFAYGLDATPDPPPALAARLTGRLGAVVAAAQTTITWEQGHVLSTTLDLPVAAGAAPARALLQAGLVDADGNWQPATSPGGRSLTVPVDLTTVKLAPATPVSADPQQPIDAAFGNQVALRGYTVVAGAPAPTLTFYWQALAPPAHDYTIFVHLFDAAGQRLTQHDGQPQQGWYPTSIWAPGEVVTDTVTLSLPDGAPPGPYTMAVGLYRLETLQRLPATRDGLPQPDGQVLLDLNLP